VPRIRSSKPGKGLTQVSAVKSIFLPATTRSEPTPITVYSLVLREYAAIKKLIPVIKTMPISTILNTEEYAYIIQRLLSHTDASTGTYRAIPIEPKIIIEIIFRCF
jgi:hypothetical protein